MPYCRKPQPADDDGFTLIELLVVIVIIGILAAIAIPIYLHQRQKAVNAGIESDLTALATIEETVYDGHQTYLTGPTAADRLADLRRVGWRASKDNVVDVAVESDRYCIRGSNGAAAKDGGTGGFYWYDSAAGGLSTSQPDGACADATTWDRVS